MTAEPRFYKTTKDYAWSCPVPACTFHVNGKRLPEVQANINLHNDRKHP